jgi:hypothetical protein
MRDVASVDAEADARHRAGASRCDRPNPATARGASSAARRICWLWRVRIARPLLPVMMVADWGAGPCRGFGFVRFNCGPLTDTSPML